MGRSFYVIYSRLPGWGSLGSTGSVWGMLAPLPFASLFGRKVAWSWKVVVLCHPCDRSLLLGCHLLSLSYLEGGVLVFVLMGLGVLDEKRLGVFSLFSVMLMDTPGFGRAAVL